ncbi:MAG: HesA/MoeB/ThiF family protein [Elusimicrobiales bacterium]|nr:HesA/MoeB/ThiF family protein [Elusimicrobiales bacterium]
MRINKKILSKEEIERYSRQIAVKEIGLSGQSRLASARIFIVGIGGLGGLASALFAGAGIGEIAIADSGPLEISNLHRQMLYRMPDSGRLKTQAAAESLKALNPNVKITYYEQYLHEENMLNLFKGFDCVLDCSDNFKTRTAINSACDKLRIPCVYGAVYAFEGQAAVFAHDGKSACLECVFPGIASQPDTKCSENGVAGPAAAMIASIQANEALKLILGLPGLKNKMLMADFLNCDFNVMDIRKRASCSVCMTGEL